MTFLNSLKSYYKNYHCNYQVYLKTFIPQKIYKEYEPIFRPYLNLLDDEIINKMYNNSCFDDVYLYYKNNDISNKRDMILRLLLIKFPNTEFYEFDKYIINLSNCFGVNIPFIFVNMNLYNDVNINILNIEKQYITILPKLKPFQNLTELNISNNKLRDVSQLTTLKKLVTLDCGYNTIKSLPILPNLTTLRCQYNRLTRIKSYPKLEYLICWHNPIIEILSMPKLKKLMTCNTYIDKINDFPELELLRIEQTKISYVPYMKNLSYIEFRNTYIKSLPEMPKLNYLVCDHELKSLPYLSTPAIRLSVSYGSLIHSIVGLNNINSFMPTEEQSENIRLRINILARFRELRYALYLRDKFHNWLWKNVRRNQLEEKYHPKHLMNLVNNNNWIKEIENW